MPHGTFAAPDLTTFCGLDELGLVAVGQDLAPGRAVIACRVLAPDPWCRGCGEEGVMRDSVSHKLAHEPGEETEARGGSPLDGSANGSTEAPAPGSSVVQGHTSRRRAVVPDS